MEEVHLLLESCVSTNDEARRLGEQGAPEGSWVSARTQSGGRGRMGRHWISSDTGNLFISIICRSPAPSHFTWVPLAAAVGLTECLLSRFPTLDLKIKWPNDVLGASGKIAGILCESVGGKGGAFIIIGLGLNCAVAPKIEAPLRPASSISGELEKLGEKRRVTAEMVRQDVTEAVTTAVSLLSQGEAGASAVAARYERVALLRSGTFIEWETQGELRSGVVAGLGKAGELLVNRSGFVESLYAEDVRVGVC